MNLIRTLGRLPQSVMALNRLKSKLTVVSGTTGNHQLLRDFALAVNVQSSVQRNAAEILLPIVSYTHGSYPVLVILQHECGGRNITPTTPHTKVH